MRKVAMRTLGLALAIMFYAAPSARASLLINDNFSSFSSGNLVGQNGYVTFGSSVTSPLQVTGGALVIPAIAAGTAADGQDVSKPLSTPFAVPGSGTASLFVGLNMTVNAAQSNPSYFAALVDGGNFGDFRMTAKDNSSVTPNTYLLGVRVNGQGGYPFVYGSALTYGTAYNVVMEADLVAGNANDVAKLFINPTSGDVSAQTAYATATYSSGTVADPTSPIGSLLFSQFASATSGQDGVTFGSVRVADTFGEAVGVPEPASLSLLCLGGLMLIRRRR